MSDRSAEIYQFLDEAGLSSAIRTALAGDASSRRYERIYPKNGACTLILMDAPGEIGKAMDAFVDAATYLTSIRLSAPQIYSVDRQNGFMLLEDLGDDLVARVVEKDPKAEAEIYGTAVDLLVELQNHQPPENFPPHSPEAQAELSALSIDWYRRYAIGDENAQFYRALIKEIVKDNTASIAGKSVFVHRDYHAENLVWLPERDGLRRLGILDFQDGSIAHPAYDLVSLLEDARRDLGPAIRSIATRKYCEATGIGASDIERQLAVCGAQRNLRIVGVFARLSIRDRKPWYLDLLPRVWRHLESDLSHPVNFRLKELVERTLPPPDAGILNALRRSA